MNYQKAKILLCLITLTLIASNKTSSQTSCDATIHAIDSTIRELVFQKNKTSGHSDSETPFDTLNLRVLFTFDTYGDFKDIKVKKLQCVKCGDEDKTRINIENLSFVPSVPTV